MVPDPWEYGQYKLDSEDYIFKGDEVGGGLRWVWIWDELRSGLFCCIFILEIVSSLELMILLPQATRFYKHAASHLAKAWFKGYNFYQLYLTKAINEAPTYNLLQRLLSPVDRDIATQRVNISQKRHCHPCLRPHGSCLSVNVPTAISLSPQSWKLSVHQALSWGNWRNTVNIGIYPWFDEGDSHVKKSFLVRATHVLKGVSAKVCEDPDVGAKEVCCCRFKLLELTSG